MSYEPTAEAAQGRQRLAANLRRIRETSGWTQEALALEAGLDRSFLADIEAARHSCMVDRVFDLARALQVPAADLLK